MAIRQPAVAGLFYPSRAEKLEREVRKFLVAGRETSAVGAVVPHAGYVYSGPVAGAL